MSFCNACTSGKMHQFHFSPVSLKTTTPFQLVHSDLWGPSSETSVDGYRYYVHFIDDFTRYTWAFPLKLKSETVSVFHRFYKFNKTQFNSKIKSLQTDWGGEFRPLLQF